MTVLIVQSQLMFVAFQILMNVSLEHTTVIRSVPTTLALSVAHVEVDFCSQLTARVVLVCNTQWFSIII